MRKLVLVGLGLWALAAVVVGGILLLNHAALRIPARDDARLRTGVASLGHAGSWRVVHVMYRDCACSQKTIAHLVARRPVPGIDETVLLVDDAGAADDTALREAGYRTKVITPNTLYRDLGITAAPVLVIARPDGSIAYSGGYNRHKQEARFMDVAILREAVHAHGVPTLPVFGCLTSRRLARAD